MHRGCPAVAVTAVGVYRIVDSIILVVEWTVALNDSFDSFVQTAREHCCLISVLAISLFAK